MVASQSPFANVLHVETIAKLARASAMDRGRAYMDRVSDLERRDARLTARVLGTRRYLISIWVKGDGLGYVCSCPAGAEGEFCKHLVAVALVWVERTARR